MSKTMTRVPCAKCPFRKDVPIYLHRERRIEIGEALMSGQIFWCHGTVDYTDEDEDGFERPNTTDAAPCCGAEKAMNASGTSTQMGRISERLGLVNLDEIGGADCWPIYDWMDLAEGATGDNPIEEEVGETCSVVNPGCLAPAGFGYGNGVVPGTEYVDTWCDVCGDPACENCMIDGVCAWCAEPDDSDLDDD